jgi:hypothetical protein
MYKRRREYGDLSERDNQAKLVARILKFKYFYVLADRFEIKVKHEAVMTNIGRPDYTGVCYAVFKALADAMGRTRLGYKDPADVIHLPLLAEILPTARFIHIIRDGRDVASSFQKTHMAFGGLYTAARYWARSVQRCSQDGASLGDRYHELRFEDLIHDTESVARTLGWFINGDAHPEQVDAFVQHLLETRRVDRASAYKTEWNHKMLNLFEAAAGDVLFENRYPLMLEGKADISPVTAGYYILVDKISRGIPRRVHIMKAGGE